MRKLFLILAVMFQTVLCYSQRINPDYDFRNAGSAKTLKGKTYVLVLFVSCSNYADWNKDEMDAMYQKIFQAFSWLKKSSEGYNSQTDFSLYVLGDKEKIRLEYIPQGPFEGKYSTELLRKAMIAAGYDKVFDFEKYAHDETGSDNCVVYVCCNYFGRSFALPVTASQLDYYTKYGKNRDLLEGCVLYKGDSQGTTLYPSIIAHETLHLFGAADLYDVYGGNTSQLDKAMQSYFPTSIMRQVPYDINSAQIDNLTAYLVGISSRYESWYGYFLKQ